MIPGVLISLLTFPGVIAHEMAHLCFCRLLGVQVFRVCYYRFGNPSGYVLHASPPHSWQHLLIGIGPFFFNSLLGIALALPLVGHLHHVTDRWQWSLLLWLAISVGMHTFPSTGDARGIWSAAWSHGTPWLVRLLAIPIVAFIYLLAFGSVIWLDLAYGVLLAVFVPGWAMGLVR